MPDLTPLDLEELKRLQAAAVERFSGSRLESDSFGLQIWADGIKDGPTHVLDVRGWGYLTGRGRGALALTEDDGISAQRAVQAYAVAAWNSVPDLISTIERQAEEIAALREGLTKISVGGPDAGAVTRQTYSHGFEQGCSWAGNVARRALSHAKTKEGT